jgi:hypothetical protein
MERTHEDELREVPLPKPDPMLWPEGVRPIGYDGMDCLGVDREGILYWNGRMVAVERRFRFSFWQTVGALIVGTFAVAGGIGSFVHGCAAACQTQLLNLFCN